MKMPLKLERCTIRHWRADDAASLAKNANNRKVWLGLRDLFPHPYTTSVARPSAGSAFVWVKTFIATARSLGIGSVKISGDTASPAKLCRRLLIIVLRTLICTAFTPNLTQIIPLPRGFWKRAASFWKDACERTWSKMDKCSIRFFTRERSNRDRVRSPDRGGGARPATHELRVWTRASTAT